MGSLTETTTGAVKAVLDFLGLIDVSPKTPLQAYLDKAYKDAIILGNLGAQPVDDSNATLHVPISIFVLAKPGSDHHYAEVHGDEVHFSASLLKVAAMFAAFHLRAEARLLAARGGFTDEASFFAALSQQFSSTEAVPAIQTAGVGLTPRYRDILEVTGFGGGGSLTVEFVPSFHQPIAVDHARFLDYELVRTTEGLGTDANGNRIENEASLAALARVSHMYRMIVPSNNASAGECIRRLGYAYINVALIKGGFFHPPASRGIWLAADFVGGTRVEIDSVNDGKVAQATTSQKMALLFAAIQLGGLVDPDSSREMKELLAEAHTVDSAWVSRFGARKFDIAGVKVGVANLKPNTPPMGPNVYSEGLLLKWNADPTPLPHNLTGDIVVCWQNLRRPAFGTGVPAIAEIIEKAYSNFLKQTKI